MELSRRDFLKASGAGMGILVLLGKLGLGTGQTVYAGRAPVLPKKIGEKTTICCFCGAGCGAIVSTYEDGIIKTEGDPDHPINEGGMCPKGQSIAQMHQVDGKLNPYRLTKPLYRAPNSTEFVEKSWDWMIDAIAHRVKDTRDKYWNASANRVDAIGSFGGGELDNEECYLLSKMDRSLGIVYIEHCARLCHSSSVASLAESFGRGAMTNHFTDLKNADVVLIIGSNSAETHPITFKWIMRAMERGAKLIHVDPRFTRTSSKADIYAQLRSGTDIAFLGGMINYIINDMEKNPGNYNMEYVKQYTNAAFIINSNYKFYDGLFGEIDNNGKYSAAAKATWKYANTTNPELDLTLQNPNCAFQLLKKHYSRYDADTVCGITGTTKDTFLNVCRTFASTGITGKAGTILYAMGITQHTYGVQNIRALGIVQMLLGNMGIAGGGINALRGTSNVQGSSDFALLANYLPGYLAVPNINDTNLDAYLTRVRPATVIPQGLAADNSVNWWGNYKKYLVSLLKSWYGDAATKDNDFCFGYLPKVDPNVNYTHIGLIEAIGKDTIKGLWVWGQNPAAGGPNSNAARNALANLNWMVIADLWLNETSEFWRRPGVNSASINTEVFVLPAAASIEKEGSITNSGRWAQWRYVGAKPPGEAMPDLEIMNEVMLKIKELYKSDSSLQAKMVKDVVWDYGHITADNVMKEINGYDLTNGKLVTGFSNLKDDGTTSSGSWIYCNAYTDADGNKLKKRDNVDNHPSKIGQFANWSWCWPMNRRIIYNRAGVDLDGKPWDSEHPVVTFDPANNAWVGDVIDGGGNAINLAAKGAKNLPFIMNAEGIARLWGFNLADGPLPEQYEPWESPLAKNPISGTMNNPPAFIGTYMNTRGTPDRFPIVGTTYRVTEHWQTGIMTRNLPWLVEMMPDMFVELSEELAAEKGIKNGERVIVTSARGEVNAVAIVTKRFKPMQVGGKTIHEIGVSWQWGYSGMAKGDSGNLLTSHVGDANTSIPEYKAFLANIRKA